MPFSLGRLKAFTFCTRVQKILYSLDQLAHQFFSLPCVRAGICSRALRPRTAERREVSGGHALHFCWRAGPLPWQTRPGHKRWSGCPRAGSPASVGSGWTRRYGPEQNSAVCSTFPGMMTTCVVKHCLALQVVFFWRRVLYICFQEKRSLPGDREQAVKRAFKSFVEERDDKYTMELLLLPSALKEELLGLAHSPTTTNSSSQVRVPFSTLPLV